MVTKNFVHTESIDVGAASLLSSRSYTQSSFCRFCRLLFSLTGSSRVAIGDPSPRATRSMCCGGRRVGVFTFRDSATGHLGHSYKAQRGSNLPSIEGGSIWSPKRTANHVSTSTIEAHAVRPRPGGPAALGYCDAPVKKRIARGWRAVGAHRSAATPAMVPRQPLYECPVADTAMKRIYPRAVGDSRQMVRSDDAR
jgi:hypothetical protein